MTTELAERRKGRALTLFLIAGVLAAVAAITVAIETRASRPDAVAGPVVPELADTIAGAQRISITSREATYRIERVERAGRAGHEDQTAPEVGRSAIMRWARARSAAPMRTRTAAMPSS